MKSFCFCFLLALLTLPAMAETQGLYLGGAVGQSFVKTEVSDIQDVDFKLDENDFAFKFMAGVRMGAILGFEGGYKHLGNVRDKVADYTFESRTSGYDLCAVGNFYLGIVDLFAKAGAFWWDQENKLNGVEETEGGTNFMWGIGATLRLGTLGVRAEWERFEIEAFDRLSLLSVGLIYGL
ncbi:porin family protein [candidate division KSB1 bacterium]|nr:outer membrane beta-barrel protein [candidate division KSB1 bacterium]RQW07046.1 MAG: porin family protein [candidate division KSB1 bacterium]